MTRGSPDLIKKLLYLKGTRLAPSSTKGDLITLSGKDKNGAEKDLAAKLVNDVTGVKSVRNLMTIEKSK